MVVDSLIYHPAVTHYNKFVSTTVGRDKALRTIQYFSRFLAWYISRSVATTDLASTSAPTFSLIKANLGLVRKCLRIGKFVEHFRAAATLWDAPRQPQRSAGSANDILRYLAVGRQLGYAAYLSLDTLTYLDAAGIKRSEFAKRCQREAYKAWIFGLACSAVSGAYSLYMLGKSANGTKRNKSAAATVGASSGGGAGGASQEAEKTLESKKIARERQQVQLQLVSDVCDLTIPSSALAYVGLSDGVVGLAGTVSSLIGLNAQWAKTA